MVGPSDVKIPQPKSLQVLRSIGHSLRTVRPPRPDGDGSMDHDDLGLVLNAVADGGIRVVDTDAVDRYLAAAAGADPDTFHRDAALAYWLNLYNAAAIRLAVAASRSGAASVLRVPGAFQRPVVTVSGEELSLDAIEHAKVRRFGDPRIHAALVCGAVSCPTLGAEPYRGDALDTQLDDQMRHFLAEGGAVADRDTGVLRLSRIFRWFGGDITRPHRMPTFLPARPRAVAGALIPWLPSATADWVRAARPKTAFLPYDWALGCRVA